MTTSVTQPISLCDLEGLHAPILDEIRQAIDDVLVSQAYINGPQVALLEERIAEYCGTAHAVGCSSGTDALLLSLMALDIGPGDEVITTPYTFFATVGAIARLGATPVFVDIEPDTFNIDATQIEAAVTARTKAIIPVHLFGQTADMDPILAIARERGLFVVEDAAQAIGAEYKGRRAGSMGTVGCFSFFPSKNLGCLGDGGMVVTNDAALAERMRILRNHGGQKKYQHEMVGGNFRIDTIQAAVLSVKLAHLDRWNERRRDSAAAYRKLMMEGAQGQEIVLPVEVNGRRHVYNQFVIRIPERDRVRESLLSEGISTAVYYPSSLHRQVCFRHVKYGEGDFPVAEMACHDTLALPIHPGLESAVQQRIVESLAECLQQVGCHAES